MGVVGSGASLSCTCGTSDGVFTTFSTSPDGDGPPIGSINDYMPANISNFGMCNSPANPQVAAATDAANGVLTDQPCTPAVAMPWQPPNPDTTVGGVPALDTSSLCQCQWGGTISIGGSS